MSDIRTDRWGRYWAPDPITGEEKAFTRATTCAKTISDTYGLEQWRNRQVARGVAMREDLQALAAALPESEKKQLNDVVQQAVDHAAPSSGANVGTALHSWTAQHDRGEMPRLTGPWQADVEAYIATLAKYGVRTIPSLVERYVCMTQPMDVAGQFDRIVEWEGKRYIADVKTSPDLSYSWGEISVQLALYAHAQHIWNSELGGAWTPFVPVNLEQGLVIHLPAKQAKCELWWVDLEAGWKAAMLAMEVREWRKRKNLARPFGVDLLGKSPVRLVSPTGDGEIAARGSAPNGPSTPPDVVPTGELSPEAQRLTAADEARKRVAGDQGKLADV